MAMERLTWKSVDAPSFAGAGALTESANNAIQAALGSAGSAVGGIQARRRNAYSADALLRAGQIGDPAQVAAFMESIRQENPNMLTDGALQSIMGLKDSVLKTEGAALDNRNLLGDITAEEKERADAAALQAAIQGNASGIFAAQAAGINGDKQGAVDQFGQLVAANPLLLGTAAAGAEGAVTDNGVFQTQRAVEKGYQDGVEAEALSDATRDRIQGLFAKGVVSAEDAKYELQKDSTLTPEEKLAGFAEIDARIAENQSIVSPFADSFNVYTDGNNALGGSQKRQAVTSQLTEVTATQQNKLEANPVYRLEQTKAKLGDLGVDSKAGLQEALGLDDESWSQSEIDNSIKDISAEFASRNINVTEADIVAAIAANYATDTWGMPFSKVQRGDRKVDKRAVIEMLSQTHGSLRTSLYEDMEADAAILDQITSSKSKLDALEAAATQVGDRPRGQLFRDEAAEAALQMEMLLQEAYRLQNPDKK